MSEQENPTYFGFNESTLTKLSAEIDALSMMVESLQSAEEIDLKAYEAILTNLSNGSKTIDDLSVLIKNLDKQASDITADVLESLPIAREYESLRLRLVRQQMRLEMIKKRLLTIGLSHVETFAITRDYLLDKTRQNFYDLQNLKELLSSLDRDQAQQLDLARAILATYNFFDQQMVAIYRRYFDGTIDRQELIAQIFEIYFIPRLGDFSRDSKVLSANLHNFNYFNELINDDLDPNFFEHLNILLNLFDLSFVFSDTHKLVISKLYELQAAKIDLKQHALTVIKEKLTQYRESLERYRQITGLPKNLIAELTKIVLQAIEELENLESLLSI